MIKIGKSASDNNRRNDSIHIQTITDKIKKFDQHTDPRQNQELRINIPIGMLQFTKLSEFGSRHIYFDLIYSIKRLRFTVELARNSNVGKIEITSLISDGDGKLTSYIINQQMKLSLPDMLALIERITEYFKPQFFNIHTIEKNEITPPEVWLADIPKR